MLPVHFLFFEAETVAFQSRLDSDVQEVVCLEFLWYGLIITYYSTFFQDSVKVFQNKTPEKSDFVIKI